VLLQSKNGGQYRQIFDSTCAIHFFGTPHQGLEIDELLSMIDDVSHGQSSRSDFVKQLQEGANFLDTQRDDITSLWDQTSSIEIVSFYETKTTAVVKKSSSGDWGRGGDEVKMVKKNSAQLFWPSEHRVPVGRNHTDMVRFCSSEDATYRTVVTHMNECVNNLATSHANKLANLSLSKDQSDCLKSLNPFDCETYRDNLFLKRHQNTCTWIFADECFRDYIENDHNRVLWIHGGPGCGKSVLSSVLSKELLCCNENIFGGNYSVAYFFYDDKDERLRTESAVLLNLLAQLLKQDPGVLIHFSAESEYVVHKKRTSWNFGMLWRVFDRIVRDDNVERHV